VSPQNHRNQREDFRRRSQHMNTGETFLIVTEGSETEPRYISELRYRLKLSAVDVFPAPKTDALSVVDYAIEKRDSRRKKSKTGCDVAYDSAWAVFDTERADINPHLNAALQKAKANRIKVALSNPCFEFWLLLHYAYCTAPFENCKRVERELRKKYINDYEKGAYSVRDLFPSLPDAVKRAERCREHHRTSAGDNNPSTTVDELIRELNSATRSYLKLDI
jgi:hypothetical protein